MPTNVLFLYAAPWLGSVWTVCRNAIHHLDRAQLRVHVALDRQTTGDLGLAPEEAQVARYELRTGAGPLKLARGVAEVAAYVRREKVDVIHANEDATSVLLGVAVARATGAKLLVHYHTAPGIYGRGRRAIMRAGARAATLNVGVSQFIADELAALGVPPTKIDWVANAIETDVFRPGLDGRAMRTEYGIADDEVLVVQVSRIWRDKRQEDLVRAVALARRDVPNLRCLIIGWEDPRYQGPFASYTAELRDIAARASLGDALVIAKPRPEAPLLHAASDIAALPSVDEPFGLVAAEAMACAKPVVGVVSGALPEIIQDGVTGYLAPPRDPAALAAKIVTLAKDPGLRARLGAAGRARAVEVFSAERLGRELGERYARVAAASRSTPFATFASRASGRTPKSPETRLTY